MARGKVEKQGTVAEPGAGPPVEIDPVEVAGRLRMSVARLARLLRQQDESGLSATLTAALATIDREGPLTLGELAARERVAPPSVTKLVAKLEDRGLVERSVDDRDRRVHRVAISATGRRRLAESRTRRTAWLATRLTELTPEDLQRLDAVVPVLDALAGAGRPAPSQPPAPEPDRPGADQPGRDARRSDPA